MFPVRLYSHVRLQSQLGMRVKEANRVGAQDARYAAMSVLYTQYSLQDAVPKQIGIR
jgi:hypothetical protein